MYRQSLSVKRHAPHDHYGTVGTSTKIPRYIPQQKLRAFVYIGGESCAMVNSFLVASSKFSDQMEFYTMNVGTLRKLDCDCPTLCDYIRNNYDKAFWITHPHQGLEGETSWDLQFIESDLVNGLKGIQGYPKNRDQCADPAFTQVRSRRT